MTTIPFTKMHALGNDFIVLDGVQRSITITPDLIRQMADRHLGIGCDQLLLIESYKQPTTNFQYRIFNADGGEVAQCGNGARCIGKFLLATGLIPPDTKKITLNTKARSLEVHFHADQQIAVNMGAPIFDPQSIPFKTSQEAIVYEFKIQDQTLKINALSMGNPHAVLLVENIHNTDVAELGKKIASDPAFPESVNVSFMQVVSKNLIHLRVYERGVGETLACGSAACAAVVAGQLRGLLNTEVAVVLPGGRLKVSWLQGNNSVWLSGPTEIVFKGEWLC